jgi:hypothetical protein
MMTSDWRSTRNALVRDASNKGVGCLANLQGLAYGVPVPCDVRSTARVKPTAITV